MNVGSVLSAAMEQKRINQTALAQQVGVSQSYISQICSGRKVPTVSVLNRISECLDIDLQDFFREESLLDLRKAEQEETVQASMSRDEAYILGLCRGLSTGDMAILRDLAERLYKHKYQTGGAMPVMATD
ncbi:MAG: helix-turn-helix transcriptional regulator [Clostridia bacterium]|nr:helix-turn-helix transcriptional regulator [Clostridia bacterium]